MKTLTTTVGELYLYIMSFTSTQYKPQASAFQKTWISIMNAVFVHANFLPCMIKIIALKISMRIAIAF